MLNLTTGRKIEWIYQSASDSDERAVLKKERVKELLEGLPCRLKIAHLVYIQNLCHDLSQIKHQLPHWYFG